MVTITESQTGSNYRFIASHILFSISKVQIKFSTALPLILGSDSYCSGNIKFFFRNAQINNTKNKFSEKKPKQLPSVVNALIERYLTWLLELDDLAKINWVWQNKDLESLSLTCDYFFPHVSIQWQHCQLCVIRIILDLATLLSWDET